jgi:hypothetical protein
MESETKDENKRLTNYNIIYDKLFNLCKNIIEEEYG